jgi:hypothetical protein
MGADVYLRSVSERCKEKWEPLFESAVAERDAFPNGSVQAKEAQKRVSETYDQMYAEGYFRDSYNATTTLHHCGGLSWWRDIVPMLSKRTGDMSVPNMKKFRAMLEAHPIHRGEVATHLAHERARYPGEIKDSDDDWFTYHVEKRAALIKLLDQAIALKEPLHMSL